jgi:hypothetical protein
MSSTRAKAKGSGHKGRAARGRRRERGWGRGHGQERAAGAGAARFVVETPRPGPRSGAAHLVSSESRCSIEIRPSDQFMTVMLTWLLLKALPPGPNASDTSA